VGKYYTLAFPTLVQANLKCLTAFSLESHQIEALFSFYNLLKMVKSINYFLAAYSTHWCGLLLGGGLNTLEQSPEN
jgi:hypothetical protein